MFDISLYFSPLIPFPSNLLSPILYYYDTNLLKSKQWQRQRQPGPFIQMKFFLTKRKIANIRPSLHFYGIIILVKKAPLQRNGKAIPKICKQSYFVIMLLTFDIQLQRDSASMSRFMASTVLAITLQYFTYRDRFN